MTDTRLTFRKAERMRHKSLVDGVFESGITLYEWPLRLTFRTLTPRQLEDSFRHEVPGGIAPLQLMVTIPKRKLHHAVERVRMRRLIKEAYRLQRLPLKQTVAARDDIRTMSIAVVYMAPKLCDMQTISAKMGLLLKKLIAKIEQE